MFHFLKVRSTYRLAVMVFLGIFGYFFYGGLLGALFGFLGYGAGGTPIKENSYKYTPEEKAYTASVFGGEGFFKWAEELAKQNKGVDPKDQRLWLKNPNAVSKETPDAGASTRTVNATGTSAQSAAAMGISPTDPRALLGQGANNLSLNIPSLLGGS